MIRAMLARQKVASEPLKEWFDAIDFLVAKGWKPVYQNNELGIGKDGFFIALSACK